MFDYASIIVATYNRPDALRLVLAALDEQTIGDFEVIVADDGSSEETRDTIDSLRDRVAYPLKHVWQEDRGFRAARARNLAALATEGDYLIFLDGDCIPPTDFVAAHRWISEKGWWVRGNRVNLSQALTARVLAENLPVNRWPFWRWLAARIGGHADRATPMLRLRTQLLRNRNPKSWRGGKTCNLGVWRDDFLRVDGLDETYEGYGREDSDLVVRLINAGVYRKEGRYVMPVIHLWHPEPDRSAWESNSASLAEVIEKGHVRARRGMSQHLLRAGH